MLKPETLKIALVLMLRAPLKGNEAINVAAAIQELDTLYEAMTSPPKPETEADDGNDS